MKCLFLKKWVLIKEVNLRLELDLKEWLLKTFDHYAQSNITEEEKENMWIAYNEINRILKATQPKNIRLVLYLSDGKETNLDFDSEPNRDVILQAMDFYKANSYQIKKLHNE